MKRFVFSLLAFFVLIVLSTGCFKQKAGSIKRIKHRGELQVLVDSSFPPYEYKDENGQMAGVDIDIAKRVAEKLHVKLQLKILNLQQLIPAIQKEEADMGLAGITINFDRREKVDFSIPYSSAIQYIIVPEKSEVRFMEDLAGKIVIAKRDTTSHILLEEVTQYGVLSGKSTTVLSEEGTNACFIQMLRKKADAMVIDENVAIQLTKGTPGFKCMPLFYSSGAPIVERYGVIVPRSSDTLLLVINQTIEEMQKDGSLERSFQFHSKKFSELLK